MEVCVGKNVCVAANQLVERTCHAEPSYLDSSWSLCHPYHTLVSGSVTGQLHEGTDPDTILTIPPVTAVNCPKLNDHGARRKSTVERETEEGSTQAKILILFLLPHLSFLPHSNWRSLRHRWKTPT